MIEVLLYTTMNCTDTAAMLARIESHDWLEEQAKVELIEVIQEATPHCAWDAND